MPELPEVETIARALRTDPPALPGRTIRRVILGWPRHIAHPEAQVFQEQISGRTILDVQRRGKYLVFPLDDQTMLIHLRMSGDLLLAAPSTPAGRFEHTVFQLDNHWELRFSDARKFGKIFLLEDADEILGSLGPEPLDRSFRAETLFRMLAGRRRALKPLLMDQQFLAGVGNIYADEALHRAQLHPRHLASELSQGQAHRLWRSLRETLRQGLRSNGASIDWVYRGGNYQNRFRVYQQNGRPCPACGSLIERIVVSQRGTHFCPTCQMEGDR